MNDWKALVVGTGISGIGAARLLHAKKIETILYDEKEDIDILKYRKNWEQTL